MLAVPHVPDAVHGTLLGFSYGNGAGGHLVAKGLDNTQGDLCCVFQVRLALFQSHFPCLVGVVDRYSGETQKAEDQWQPEFLNKGQFHKNYDDFRLSANLSRQRLQDEQPDA